MQALVLIEPNAGQFIEWDTVNTYVVRMLESREVILTFTNGKAHTISAARKVARRWWDRDRPKLIASRT